jgi:mRNA interferase MazF
VKRGDFYRVAKPGPADPKQFRVFVVVSRQALIDSRFSTVVCAPVYSARLGLTSEVPVGPDEGLRQESSIHCDALVSMQKANLTRFIGSLALRRHAELDRALIAALGIDMRAL